MRLLLPLLVLAAVATGCPNGSDESCDAYYRGNPPGVTPDQVAFCLAEGKTKTAGNCCVSDSQCVSGRCCPSSEASCGSVPQDSCECY